LPLLDSAMRALSRLPGASGFWIANAQPTLLPEGCAAGAAGRSA